MAVKEIQIHSAQEWTREQYFDAVVANMGEDWQIWSGGQRIARDLTDEQSLALLAAHSAAIKEAYEKGKQDGVREHYVGK